MDLFACKCGPRVSSVITSRLSLPFSSPSNTRLFPGGMDWREVFHTDVNILSVVRCFAHRNYYLYKRATAYTYCVKETMTNKCIFMYCRHYVTINVTFSVRLSISDLSSNTETHLYWGIIFKGLFNSTVNEARHSALIRGTVCSLLTELTKFVMMSMRFLY